MDEKQAWKRMKLYSKENGTGNTERNNLESRLITEHEETEEMSGQLHASRYLIAREDRQEEWRKELLYQILGPVFFGKKEAESWQELAELFRRRYGIDVEHDFYEGDEHYEEYLEARQAIAEGMSIYSGSIAFEEDKLAEYAEKLWENLEETENGKFRRINTMLEE